MKSTDSPAFSFDLKKERKRKKGMVMGTIPILTDIDRFAEGFLFCNFLSFFFPFSFLLLILSSHLLPPLSCVFS
ncbi:hypothetical protein CSUI_007801, partial [Cystoisospora suis]